MEKGPHIPHDIRQQQIHSENEPQKTACPKCGSTKGFSRGEFFHCRSSICSATSKIEKRQV